MAFKGAVHTSLGLIAFLFTFLCSLVNNTWLTSLIRAFFGFIFFFILGYILRFFLTQTLSKKNLGLNQKQNTYEERETKEEGIHQEKEITAEDSSFQVIQPSSLHKEEGVKRPDKIAQTVRKWTTENEEG